MLKALCNKYNVAYMDCDLSDIAAMSYDSIVFLETGIHPNPYIIKDSTTWKWVSLEFRDYFMAVYLINHPEYCVTDILKYKGALLYYKSLDYAGFYERYVSEIVSSFLDYCNTSYLDIKSKEPLTYIRQGIMFNYEYFHLNGNSCKYKESEFKPKLDGLWYIMPELFMKVSSSGYKLFDYFGIVDDSPSNPCNSRDLFTLVNDAIIDWGDLHYILNLEVI